MGGSTQTAPASRRLVTRGETRTIRFAGWRSRGFSLHTTAHGVVADRPDWRFSFEEEALFALKRQWLTNWGMVGVETPHGLFRIRFAGGVDLLHLRVAGSCSVEGVSGCFAGWRSTGVYAGQARLRFEVIFTLEWPQELESI